MLRHARITRRVLAASAATAATALILVSVPAAPAAAIPSCPVGYQCTYTYYSSSTLDQVVGGHTRFCDGTTDTFGTTSRWVVLTTARCNGL